MPMLFVGYEPSSKAWRFYNPITKCVHMSRDAVFEEDRPWEWSCEEHGVRYGDKESFTVEHVTVRGEFVIAPDLTPVRAPTVHGEETPTHPPTPGRARSPTTSDPVEFVSPPMCTPDLDSGADNVPRRFCTMQNILG
jgi:hypothetical protein